MLKNTEAVVSDSIGLLEKFSTFLGKLGQLAYAAEETTNSVREVAVQVSKVNKSMRQCYQNGKKRATTKERSATRSRR